MDIGYIVGMVTASIILISGIVVLVMAKKNQEKSKWAKWAILVGIIALISAVVNSAIFGNGIFY